MFRSMITPISSRGRAYRGRLDSVGQATAVRRVTSAVVLVAALALGGGAVAGASASAPDGSSGADSAETAAGQVLQTDADGSVWLCRPGLSDDPCAAPLDTTVVGASGARTVTTVTPAADSRFDCFYLYPTVTGQSTDNADLTVEPAETGVARDQASPFSQDCQVWAPMYRQRTPTSLAKGLGGDPAADEVAFQSVLSAWKDYQTHFNHGRPVIFIGHSQGAAMLIRLLSSQIDNNTSMRDRMVSAVIAGGNVTVPTGATVGSTFQNLPVCTGSTETGCVIAYSSFPEQPPADSLFGIPGQGVSLQSGQTATAGVQVACVNPASLDGETARLSPSFLSSTSATPPPAVTTPWVSYPREYPVECRHVGGATWLNVGAVSSTDIRPVVTEALGPRWGYHKDDINLAMDDLVRDVRHQERAFAATHRLEPATTSPASEG